MQIYFPNCEIRGDASALKQTLDDELKEGAKEENAKNLKRLHDADDDEDDDDDEDENVGDDEDDVEKQHSEPVKLNALKGMDLKQFEIKGSEAQWAKAMKTGKTVGIVSVKGSGSGGSAKESGKKDKSEGDGAKKKSKPLLKANKKKRKFIEK